MTWYLPLPAVIPLLAAAVNVATDHVTPDWVHRAISLVGVAGALVFAILVLDRSLAVEQLHWFGGWQPRSGVALGISFAADPLGAGLAALACGLTLVALLYSLTFISVEQRNHDVLLCVICGAVCGFGLTGDLFNMFVWLELMGVAGYALTGFELRRMGPLQGALNFAVVNTVGGYLVVIGIGLLYARTGALNLAQIGRTLSGEPAGGEVVVAMTLIVVGFLCKAAVVPFHFWLADAYAVAPAPVCLVFAGVMTDVGLFGVGRLWFDVFDAAFGAQQRFVGDVLLWFGIVTALLGGVMALLQRHLKRLLAFSVIAHIGIMLAGVALLSSKGVAGAAMMLLAHGLATGGLFLTAGILGVRRPSRALGVLWLAGALALLGPPYVGVFMGHALIDEAAAELGRHWVQPLLWLAGALAAAALFRSGGEVFFGLGRRREEGTDEPRDANVGVLAALTVVLVVLGLVPSLVPGLTQRVEYGADRFRDRAGYADRVLHGKPMQTTAHLPVAVSPVSTESLVYGCAATALALATAALALFRPQLRRRRLLAAPVAALHAVHTGVIGDYVMWVVVGTAVLGGVWALGLR